MSSKNFFLKSILLSFIFNSVFLIESIKSVTAPMYGDLSEDDMKKLQEMQENISPEDYMVMIQTFFEEYSRLNSEEKALFAESLGMPLEELEEMSNIYQEEMKNFENQIAQFPAPKEKETENTAPTKNPSNENLSKKSNEEIKIFEEAEEILSNFLSKTTEKLIFKTSVENFPNLISDIEISVYYIKFIIPLVKNLIENNSTSGLKEFELLKNFLKKVINLDEIVSNIQINNLKKIHSEFENNLLKKYSARNKEECERNIKNLIQNKITLIENIKNSDFEKSEKDKKIAHEKFSLSELENDFEKLKIENLELENKNIAKNASKEQEIIKKNFLEAANELNKLFPEILDLLENFIKNYMPEEYKKLKENSDLIKKTYETEKNTYLSNAQKAKGSLVLDNVKTSNNQNYRENENNYNDSPSDFQQDLLNNEDYSENYPQSDSQNESNNKLIGGGYGENSNKNENSSNNNSPNNKNQNLSSANKSSVQTEKPAIKKNKTETLEEKDKNEEELEILEALLNEYFSDEDKDKKTEGKEKDKNKEETFSKIKELINSLTLEKVNFKKKESESPFFLEIFTNFSEKSNFSEKYEDKFNELFKLIIEKLNNFSKEKIDTNYRELIENSKNNEATENLEDIDEDDLIVKKEGLDDKTAAKELDNLAKNDPVIKTLISKFED